MQYECKYRFEDNLNKGIIKIILYNVIIYLFWLALTCSIFTCRPRSNVCKLVFLPCGLIISVHAIWYTLRDSNGFTMLHFNPGFELNRSCRSCQRTEEEGLLYILGVKIESLLFLPWWSCPVIVIRPAHTQMQSS